MAASACAAFLLLELGLRICGHDITLFCERDRELGWRNQPGARATYTDEGDGLVVINSLGLRGPERTRAKPPGTFRIAVLGDSTTQAIEVQPDETYCQVLERELSGSRPIEVLNCGVVGYSPVQELLLLRSDVFALDPDLVLVAVFLDNDVSGSSRAIGVSPDGSPYGAVRDGELEIDFSDAERGYDEFFREPKHTLRRYSHVYHVLYDYLQRSRRQRAVAAGHRAGIPAEYMLYRNPLPPEWEEAWVIAAAAHRDIIGECAQRGIPIVFASIPAGFTVHEPSWKRIVAQHPSMAEAEWDHDEPNRRLAELTRALEVPLLDPAALLRRAAATERLYFGSDGVQDGHMTPAGHRLLATFLAEELTRRNLLP